MDISIIFAQIIGIVCLVAGLEVVFNRRFVSAAIEDTLRNAAVLWVMGLIALVVGATVIAVQNVWSSDWRLVITVVGWIALLKGAFIMLFPGSAAWLYRKCNTTGLLMASGILAVILGLFFLYVGFLA
jgi:hypothetical protein